MTRSASIPYRRPIDKLNLSPLRTAVCVLGDIACPAGIDISASPDGAPAHGRERWREVSFPHPDRNHDELDSDPGAAPFAYRRHPDSAGSARLLNYIVVIYFIVIGLLGLFGAGTFNLR